MHKSKELESFFIEVVNPLSTKGSENCPFYMKIRWSDPLVEIKMGFEEKIQPGPKNPILGPSSFEDSGQVTRGARIKRGQWTAKKAEKIRNEY